MVAVGAIVVSMLDAFIFFPEVAAVPGPVPATPEQDTFGFAPGNDPGAHLRVTLRF
jgi:hypothetical protein